MKEFIQKYAPKIKGVISGWDRLSFRGTIRWLSHLAGLAGFLSFQKILLKDFKPWAEGLTLRVRQGCEQRAAELGIPSFYLRSSSDDKEELAREVARQNGVETGPICRFSVVEPCISPSVIGNRANKLKELVIRPRKCVWEYFYFNDPRLGFGHLRLQTWIPFTIHGCLNGRHWLERDLIRKEIDYVKMGNCFRHIDNYTRAQKLFDAQQRMNWRDLLSGLTREYFPVLERLFEHRSFVHYWSADETEFATDVVFRNTPELDRLFPMLARHALITTDSASIMRFLGKIDADSKLPPHVTGDIRGDRKRRYEGICVKHHHGGNSVKMYNKAGNILRVETTINKPRCFHVFRSDDQGNQGSWQNMRKGVSDLHRRAEVSRKSNGRYLDSLSSCDTGAKLQETLSCVCLRKKDGKSKVRALNPWSDKDHRLLSFLAKGEYSINGLRNLDLASWIEPKIAELDPDQRKRLSARVSRILRMLRAHRLIRKVPKTHRYLVTQKGKRVSTLVLIASTVGSNKLMEMAA